MGTALTTVSPLDTQNLEGNQDKALRERATTILRTYEEKPRRSASSAGERGFGGGGSGRQ